MALNCVGHLSQFAGFRPIFCARSAGFRRFRLGEQSADSALAAKRSGRAGRLFCVHVLARLRLVNRKNEAMSTADHRPRIVWRPVEPERTHAVSFVSTVFEYPADTCFDGWAEDELAPIS